MRIYLTVRRQKINLTRQLSYSAFDESGIYSEEYLKKRRETMFRLVHWKTIGKGVLRTFTLSLGEWETIAEGGLDILGSIPYDSIIDTVFGTAWIRVLLSFLNVIGYVGSTYGFLHLIWVLYKKYIVRNHRKESE